MNPPLNASTIQKRERPNAWCMALMGSLLLTAGTTGTNALEPASDALAAQDFASKLVAATESPPPSTTNASIHRPFDLVLQDHVIDGHVNYPDIAQDNRFAQYITWLTSAPAGETSHEEALAYWINAYNALAIKGIIDGKSPSSFFGRIGYFKTTKYQAGGRQINLYDLERKILMTLAEPRIHFAIVCASASCPRLRSEAYTADRLEQQLEEAAKRFINDPARNRFDPARKIASLSRIFDWFEADFEEHSGSVQRYVARYVNDPELARELANDSYIIEYLKYDWSLNGASPKR